MIQYFAEFILFSSSYFQCRFALSFIIRIYYVFQLKKFGTESHTFWERMFLHLPDGTHRLQIQASRGDDGGPSGVLIDDASLWQCHWFGKFIKILFIITLQAPIIIYRTISTRVLNFLQDKTWGAGLQYMGLSIQAKSLLITRAQFNLYLISIIYLTMFQPYIHLFDFYLNQL